MDETVEVPVQVNGKVRAVITRAGGRWTAMRWGRGRAADERVVAALDGREIKRVVTVPGRLVNFVV